MRKLVSILMAIMMLMGMMSFASAEEAPFVITVHVPYYADVEPVGCTGEEGNPVLEAIEKELNVDLQVTWAPQGDYTTKFNTVMSSDDQPMVMVVNSGLTTNANYIQMCKDGAFWDLTDILAGNEFIQKELTSKSALAVTSIEGRN